jgi:hypothetical protein
MSDKTVGMSVEEITSFLGPAGILKPSISKAVKLLLEENNRRLLEYLEKNKK